MKTYTANPNDHDAVAKALLEKYRDQQRSTVKVFEVNDCEWWAGDCTPEELLAAYMKETGCSHEDATGDVDDLPRPLTDEEMDTLKFRLVDDATDTNTTCTFREYLARMVEEGEQFPRFFATTES